MKDGLTKKQLEVLKGIGDGLCTKEIASKMKISHKTVQGHRDTLRKMFPACNTFVKLAKMAIGFGLSSLCVMFIVGCASVASAPTSPTPPSPVALAKPIKTTTVTMGWNPASGATNYVLLWGITTGYGNIVQTPQTQAHLTGLKVNTIYHFSVKCIAGGQQSPNSPDVVWKAINWPGNAPAPIP